MAVQIMVVDVDRLPAEARAALEAPGVQWARRPAADDMVAALLSEERDDRRATDVEAERAVGRRLLLNPQLAKRDATVGGVLWNAELRRTKIRHEDAEAHGWDWLRAQPTRETPAAPEKPTSGVEV